MTPTIFAFLAVMILTGVSPGTVRSGLVEKSHVHRWIEFTNTSDDIGFLDTNYRGSFENAAREYPVALIRFTGKDPSEGGSIDMRVAADCDRRVIFFVEVWMRQSGQPNLRQSMPWDERKEERVSQETSIVFEHACQAKGS